MAHPSTMTKLSLIAEDQWGFITRSQGGAAGVSPATFQRLSADGSVLERVGHGVYHLAGAPLPDLVPLRVAWLQLAPHTPAWQRTADQGVVTHRSAARARGLGDLPADEHHFTLPARRQARRSDVHIHKGVLRADEWGSRGGLLVARPARIASELLADREDPEAVAQVVADALRSGQEDPAQFVTALAPRASSLGLRGNGGAAVLRRLLDLVGDPATEDWLRAAR